MQRKSCLTLIMTCAFLLTSCGTNALVTPTQAPAELDTQIVQTISAAISQTEAAQTIEGSSAVVSTATSAPAEALPTATPQPIQTSTPFAISTQASLKPTTNIPAAYQYADDHCQWLYNYPQDGSGYYVGVDKFLVDWGIFNNGSSTWGTNYTLRWVGGTEIYGNADIPLSSTVQPGGKIELYIRAFPPQTPGKYITYWALYNDSGQDFCDFYLYFWMLKNN